MLDVCTPLLLLLFLPCERTDKTRCKPKKNFAVSAVAVAVFSPRGNGGPRYDTAADVATDHANGHSDSDVLQPPPLPNPRFLWLTDHLLTPTRINRPMQALEKDKLQLLADANASKARAAAIEEKFSAARVRERGGVERRR